MRKPIPLVRVTLSALIIFLVVLLGVHLWSIQTLPAPGGQTQITLYAHTCSNPSSSKETLILQLPPTTRPQANPNLPILNVYGNLRTTVVDHSPMTIAISKTTGVAYGIFSVNGTYQLCSSMDLINWVAINSKVLPAGYHIDAGKDLAITYAGTILISATTRLELQNVTVFEASYDGGKTFATVLNMSLVARSVPRYDYQGPGLGFWHSVAETRNGTLFAGIYRPQGLIFRSANEGHSWSLVFNASAVGSGWQNEIHDVEVDPANNLIYTATDDETGTANNRTIWVSTDFGDHWRNIYSQLKGGAGLPSLIPDAIGFLGNGSLLTLGLDDSNNRSMYILGVQPSGELTKVNIVDVPSSIVDPFFTWWIHSINPNEILWATLDSAKNRVLGSGLFTLSTNGTLTTLYTLKGVAGSIGFIQVAGPNAEGDYAVLAKTDNNLYLIVFSFT